MLDERMLEVQLNGTKNLFKPQPLGLWNQPEVITVGKCCVQ